MTTYLLVQTVPGHAEEVVSTLRAHPEIVSAEVVGGPYDIVALVQSSERYLGEGTGAAAAARSAPGVLRALECRIVERHAPTAA